MPMWENKSLAFVTACGSPDPTRSHFDAQDYMESGVPGAKVVSTGWMNRLVSLLPDNHSPVRALNFGPTIPRIFSGPASVANVEVGKANGRKMAWIVLRSLKHSKNCIHRGRMPWGTHSEKVWMRVKLFRELADEMEMANRGAPTPADNPNFGSQLAKLITKDDNIQVAFIAFGGWDTHVTRAQLVVSSLIICNL